MPFAQDLLEQSAHLANREPRRPRQASLRRAVSTAYYALFHLLIQEATRNWKRVQQRPLLAKAFEHGRMKGACDKNAPISIRLCEGFPSLRRTSELPPSTCIP
jgi:hypothetical protein